MMRVFCAISFGTPVKNLTKLLRSRGLDPIFEQTYNMAAAKSKILQADAVLHYLGCLDERVRLLIEYARENDKPVLTIEWVKKTLKG